MPLLSISEWNGARKQHRVLRYSSQLKTQNLVTMNFALLSQVKQPAILQSKMSISDLNLLHSYCYVPHLNQHRGRGILGLLMRKDSTPLHSRAQRSTKGHFRVWEDILSPNRVCCKASKDNVLTGTELGPTEETKKERVEFTGALQTPS